MTKEVFISYSTKDQAAKDELCALLDEAGISYFLDSKDLELGVDISKGLKTSLRDSRYTLMIVSENSLLSAWVGMETMFRLMEEYTTDKSRLISVVADKSVLDIDFPLKMQLHFNEKREELEAKRKQMKALGGNTKVYDVEIARLEQINVSDIMLKVRNHLGLVLGDSQGVNMKKLMEKIRGPRGDSGKFLPSEDPQEPEWDGRSNPSQGTGDGNLNAGRTGTGDGRLPNQFSGTGDGEESKYPKNYNLKNIIKLLTNAFDATGFETFAFANFSDVYRQYVPGMSQMQRITKLVSHAESFGKLDELLEAVKEENEYQYGLCGPYLKA